MENLICVKSLCELHINKLIFEKKIILPNMYQKIIRCFEAHFSHSKFICTRHGVNEIISII